MKFKVVILEIDADGKSTVTLPFPPTVGLHLQVPHRRDAHFKLKQVYWDRLKKQFEVFID